MDVSELDRSIEQGVRSLAAAVWSHKGLFTVTAAVVFLLIIATAIAIRPSYEGSTLLIGGQVDLQQLPDGTRRPAETTMSLSQIAESDEVVGKAIQSVGLNSFGPNLVTMRPSLFGRIRDAIFGRPERPPTSADPIEVALPRIKSRLNVRAEPNSDIIRIAFRDPDPIVAAKFANAVAQAFLDRQIDLYRRQGAADFFQRERQRFDAELKQASDALEKFSVRTGVYSVDEQRQLLLNRQTDLASALALTRGTIAEKSGERQALAEQLRKLAPVAQSPFVSSVVNSLSSTPSSSISPPGPMSRENGLSKGSGARATDERLADPPLLLVKVYQDSMVTLFKVNSDLTGTEDLEKQQLAEMAKVTQDLDTLSQNEQEFLALKRAVTQATFNSNTYANRVTEEQINDELNAAKLSAIKVLQKATVPLRPVFPNYILFTLVALVAGGGAGVLAAFLAQNGTLAAGSSRLARRTSAPH